MKVFTAKIQSNIVQWLNMKLEEIQTKQRLVLKPADLLVILTINEVLPRYKLSASVSHPDYGHINT